MCGVNTFQCKGCHPLITLFVCFFSFLGQRPSTLPHFPQHQNTQHNKYIYAYRVPQVLMFQKSQQNRAVSLNRNFPEIWNLEFSVPFKLLTVFPGTMTTDHTFFPLACTHLDQYGNRPATHGKRDDETPCCYSTCDLSYNHTQSHSITLHHAFCGYLCPF